MRSAGDTVFGDKYGGDRVHGDKKVYHHPRRGTKSLRPKVILLMSANPDDTGRLRLDEERREIDRAIAYAQAGDRLAVRIADAVRREDLQSALLRHEPVIAHFSGHGTGKAGILVQDGFHDPQPVPPDALTELFGLLTEGLKCVVLNACHTEQQAAAIAAHVPSVIGMRGPILDQTAIRFSAGFYQGIAHARSVRASYRLGCNLLRLLGHSDDETPRLTLAPGYADLPLIDRRD